MVGVVVVVVVVVVGPDLGHCMCLHSLLVDISPPSTSPTCRMTVTAEGGERWVSGTGGLYILGSFDSDATAATGQNQFDFFSVTKAHSYMTMTRMSSAAALALDLSSLEIFCEGGAQGPGETLRAGRGYWAALSACAKPALMFAPVVSEPSMHLDHASGLWVVVSLQALQSAVQVCRAAQAVGPWLCAHVAAVPAQWTGKDFIAYAAKAHPELSPSHHHSLLPVSSSPSSSLPLPPLFYAHGPENNSSSLTQSGWGLDLALGLVLSYVPNTIKGPSVLFTPANFAAYTPKFISLRSTHSFSLSPSMNDTNREKL